MPEQTLLTRDTTRDQRRSLRARGSRALRALLAAGVLAGSLALAPSTALASRLDSDRIGGVPLSAGTIPKSKAPDIAAKTAVIVVGNRVLWSRKSESRRAMASTTKMMTALLVLENCNLNEKVTITRTASKTPYATGLRAGEKRSVRTLLELALITSSNDAATALAIHVGGNVKGFTSLMNVRAKQLGLTDTHFANPHGLDAKGHYSSAIDLTKLMRAAVAHPEFKRIIKLKSVVLPKYGKRKARRLKSTDKLLGDVKGLRGGKTGFTGDARYCFASSARRDGVTLTSVILGSSSSSARFTSARRLLDWGFKHYKVKTLCSEGEIAGSVLVSSDSTRTVNVKLAKTTAIPVFDLLGPISRRSELLASIPAPVHEGDKLGVVRIVQGAQVIATVDAVAAESVE